MGRPSRAARLPSQSARIALARPSGNHAFATRVMPPLVTILARRSAPQARRARDKEPLVLTVRRTVAIRVRGIKHGDPGFGGSRDGLGRRVVAT